jgi:hypothetical protein
MKATAAVTALLVLAACASKKTPEQQQAAKEQAAQQEAAKKEAAKQEAAKKEAAKQEAERKKQEEEEMAKYGPRLEPPAPHVDEYVPGKRSDTKSPSASQQGGEQPK